MGLKAVAASVELGAYELLWRQDDASFAALAELFASHPDKLPSEFVDLDDVALSAEGMRIVERHLSSGTRRRPRPLVHRTADFPVRLRDMEHPPELFYWDGYLPVLERDLVAVVGERRLEPAVSLLEQLARRRAFVVDVDTAFGRVACDTLAEIGWLAGVTACGDQWGKALERQLLLTLCPLCTPPSHGEQVRARDEAIVALADAVVIVGPRGPRTNSMVAAADRMGRRVLSIRSQDELARAVDELAPRRLGAC